MRQNNSKFNVNAVFRRIYIPKPTGSSWAEAKGIRPLGVPDLEWRVSLAMISFLLYAIVEPKIGDYQFGFRPNKDVWKCWDAILDKIHNQGKYAYEFDLKACFNRLSPRVVGDQLTKYGFGKELVNYIYHLLTCAPRMSQLEMKEEDRSHFERLKKLNPEYDQEINFNRTKDVFQKNGLPQGWSLSPLLAILTMDEALRRVDWETVMYADDGIIFSKDPSFADDLHYKDLDGDDQVIKNFQMKDDWITLSEYGMVPSSTLKKDGSPKCKKIQDIIEFVGLKYSISLKSWWSWELEEWLVDNESNREYIRREYEGRLVAGSDSIFKGPKDWTWKIVPNSWLIGRVHILKNFANTENLINLTKWILGNKSIKRFGFLFINYITASSESADDLLRYIQETKDNLRHVDFKRKFEVREFGEDYREGKQGAPGKEVEYYLFPGYIPETENRFYYRLSYDLRRDLIRRRIAEKSDFPDGLFINDPFNMTLKFATDYFISDGYFYGRK